MPSWLRVFVLTVTVAIFLAAPSAASAATGALQHEAECTTEAVLPSDDGSSLPLTLGFTVRFGWEEFSTVYVNNNGNVTFGGPQVAYSPFEPSYLGYRMIAPFFADVDTRDGNGTVTWGNGAREDGTKFFCATWRDVGYYNTMGNKRNTFQVILTQSPDQEPSKSMTITLNYDKIEWETGNASFGRHGLGGNSALVSWFDGVEAGATVDGSMVPGSLLDSNLETGLIHQVVEGQAGRIQYDYSFAESYPADGVLLDFPTAGSSLPIEVCAIDGGDTCFWKRSYASVRQFRAIVPPGKYRIAVFAPHADRQSIRQIETSPLEAGEVWSTGLNLGPALTAPPAQIVVEGARHTPAGTPVLTTAEPISIALPTCANENAAAVRFAWLSDEVVLSSPMSVDPDRGTNVTLPAGSLAAGEYTVTIGRECEDEGAETLTFGLFVTPAVLVVNQYEQPIAGADVALMRADTAEQPLEFLDPETDFLTPASRANPLSTSTGGLAGWSMRMGSYQVEATADGCFNPADNTQPVARSERFRVDLNRPAPDPVTMTLYCPNAKPPAPPIQPTNPQIPVDPVVDPKPSLKAPVVAFKLGSRCVRPRVGNQRRGGRVVVPLRASLRVSRRAQVNLLIERREIAPRRFRCRNVVKPPLRRSAFKPVGRITRTLSQGRYRLTLPVAGPKRARASAVKALRLPLQRLRPGTYRITATATDRHGTSNPVRTQFILLAPRR